MKEKEMELIGGYILEVLRNPGKDAKISEIAAKVEALSSQFALVAG